ncbi:MULTISPECIES: VOC family protein [Coprobacillaceae]|uniref:VOC family protein n=1 Tax=Coprobacillaceae TaxID=2810280 RepID=UPI000E4E758B|nr:MULTISPECIES: VOC family protein [Coprobacillaceae]RHM62851.1 lactoylglutathione lyase [Coprobacillus sp. AF33-1AC]RHS95010.1 lactoylglutathione lyase [Erysipelatoclostridium sp. AM42-17]
MKFRCIHCNINVTNLNESIEFYKKALNMQVVREKEASDGSFKLVYLNDGQSDFEIELTWLKDHPQAYELGENESHICFEVEDFDQAHQLHQDMGCICFENTAMGLYFIHDPDDYWLEIIPSKK